MTGLADAVAVLQAERDTIVGRLVLVDQALAALERLGAAPSASTTEHRPAPAAAKGAARRQPASSTARPAAAPGPRPRTPAESKTELVAEAYREGLRSGELVRAMAKHGMKEALVYYHLRRAKSLGLVKEDRSSFVTGPISGPATVHFYTDEGDPMPGPPADLEQRRRAAAAEAI